MADEALRCLTDLLQSVPEWIHALGTILEASTKWQKEALFEQQPAGPPAGSSRKPSKTSSMLSRRSRDGERGRQWASSPTREEKAQDEMLRSQLPHMTQTDALRLAQRKRKTASALSDLSGPARFRSKAAVVIYYDGDTQKKFETMVRAIGANRNALRKGKIAAKVDRFSMTGSGASSEASSSDERVYRPPDRLSYMVTGATQKVDSPGEKDGTTKAFETLDDLLEKAQALCERAAHQVLRDGDCAVEMRAAKNHVVELKQLAEGEVPVLQERLERLQERQKRQPDKEPIEGEHLAVARDRTTPDNGTEKVENPFSTPGSLEVDLEADDSEGDEDFGFEVGALQLGKFGVRSTRSPAFGV